MKTTRLLDIGWPVSLRVAIPALSAPTFAALIWMHILATGCRDQYPEPPGIEGRWRQLAGITGKREYEFRDNLCTQETLVGSTVVASLQFPYAERRDSVLIGGDEHNPPRTWLVRFIGDGAMEVREVGPFVTIVMYFERL